MAFDPPIRTTAEINEILSPRTFQLQLPNGKLTLGHLPKRLQKLSSNLTVGARVEVEMTPYDLEKARISRLAAAADQIPDS